MNDLIFAEGSADKQFHLMLFEDLTTEGLIEVIRSLSFRTFELMFRCFPLYLNLFLNITANKIHDITQKSLIYIYVKCKFRRRL